MNLENLYLESFVIELSSWSVWALHGADVVTFFQGQTTQDLIKQKNGTAQWTTRLNAQGRIVGYGLFAKGQSESFFFVPKSYESELKASLEKYIVMEEVEILSTSYSLSFEYDSNKKEFGELEFSSFFLGVPGRFVFGLDNNLRKLSETEIKSLRTLFGIPDWNFDLEKGMLINETIFNHVAISYQKGCFVGQETAAKIENNRGAAFYPMLAYLSSPMSLGRDWFFQEKKVAEVIDEVITQDQKIVLVKVLRDLRVEKCRWTVNDSANTFEIEIRNLPFAGIVDYSTLSIYLYERALDVFQEDQSEKALKLLQKAVILSPHFSDAFEAYGVILGRLERFEEAIKAMDELLSVDSNSVMAHTNKSLYLMRLGRIEEAEAEKSLATVASFTKNGEEAEAKKRQEEERLKKEQEILKREQMFLSVLEIDSEDEVANYGLADIMFARQKFKESLEFLDTVLTFNPKHSVSYLLAGKCFEALNEKNKAKMIYQEGISIATKQGEMMPANEMQSRLNKL